MQHAFRRKAFPVVFDFHAHGAIKFLNPHFRPAGLRMAGHIGERFLGDAIEHGSFVTVHLLNRSKGRQADPDTRLLHEAFQKRMEGGNQPQIVQHRRAQFTSEPMHEVH